MTGHAGMLTLLLPGPTWATWRALIGVLRGERPTDETTAPLLAVEAGRRLERPRETWIAAGRRSGKSRAAAAMAILEALEPRRPPAPGEAYSVVLLSQSLRDATTIRRYVVGAAAVLGLRVSEEQNALHRFAFDGLPNVLFEVLPASSAAVRGRSVILCVADETAFWKSEDPDSADPDTAVLSALLPALATCQGRIIGISSTAHKRGALWRARETWRGCPDRRGAFVEAATRALNPTIPPEEIDDALRLDPRRGAAEYESAWLDSAGGFLSEADIDRFMGLTPDAPDDAPPVQAPAPKPEAPRQWSVYHSLNYGVGPDDWDRGVRPPGEA